MVSKKRRRAGATYLSEEAERRLPKWRDLSVREQTKKIGQAMRSVEFFITDPYMLNIKSAYPKQIELAKILTGEKPVEGKGVIKELIVAVGMRSGKTTFGAMMSLYAAFEILNMVRLDKIFPHMLPGSPVRIANIAKGEKQSKETVFAQIIGQLKNSPYFLSLEPVSTAMEVSFQNSSIDLILNAFNSSAASNVGRTLYFVVFDELAKFDDTKSKTSGWAVYEQLCKSTGTFPLQKRIDHGLKMAGNILVIGSILHINDVIMQLVEKAKKNANMYQTVVPTWEFNPWLSFKDLAPEREKSPESFWRDYGCQPYADIENLFRDPKILKVNLIRPNLLEDLFQGLRMDTFDVGGQKRELWSIERKFPSRVFRKYNYEPRGSYVLAGDPSAQKRDAFGLSLGHIERDEDDEIIYIIDGIIRFAPQTETLEDQNMKITEVNPAQISGFIRSLCSIFNVDYALFDTYHYVETMDALEDMGVEIIHNQVKLEHYEALKDSMKDFTIDICNYPFFLDECKALIVKNGRRVDHPQRGSKDTSDAVANVLYGLQEHLAKATRAPNIFAMGGISNSNTIRGFNTDGSYSRKSNIKKMGWVR